MKKKTDNAPLDQSTEEKIKRAAEKIFIEKGFAGARTRDIASEAGINLALLNYYFRSKEKLFEIVIVEKMKTFFDVILDILKNPDISLEQKIPKLVNQYSDLLMKEPNLPIFLLSELKQDPDFFTDKLNVKDKLQNQALKLLFENNFGKKEDAVQILITFLGMTLFPYIACDVVQSIFDFSKEDYNEILNKRRDLIPVWISEILKIPIK